MKGATSIKNPETMGDMCSQPACDCPRKYTTCEAICKYSSVTVCRLDIRLEVALRALKIGKQTEVMSMSADSVGEEYIPETAQIWNFIEDRADLNGGIRPITSTSTLVKT